VHIEGNLGIGVSNPTERLQVKGLVHSTSGGFRFPDGTTQTTPLLGGGGRHHFGDGGQRLDRRWSAGR
jgi:hypothetical protein